MPAAGTVFVSREPTGETWSGEPRDDDLILTRILTLDGHEDGVNRGPGCDSLERYIYLHGTNHEALLGRAALAWLRAHGQRRRLPSVRSDRRRAISSSSPSRDTRAIPDPRTGGRFHYAGLGGSGMSALAQFQVMTGGRASGSDRAFDRGERAELRAQLERLGIAVHAAGRQRRRPRLRGARGLDGGRGAGARLRRGARARAFPSSIAPSCSRISSPRAAPLP